MPDISHTILPSINSESLLEKQNYALRTASIEVEKALTMLTAVNESGSAPAEIISCLNNAVAAAYAFQHTATLLSKLTGTPVGDQTAILTEALNNASGILTEEKMICPVKNPSGYCEDNLYDADDFSMRQKTCRLCKDRNVCTDRMTPDKNTDPYTDRIEQIVCATDLSAMSGAIAVLMTLFPQFKDYLQ